MFLFFENATGFSSSTNSSLFKVLKSHWRLSEPGTSPMGSIDDNQWDLHLLQLSSTLYVSESFFECACCLFVRRQIEFPDLENENTFNLRISKKALNDAMW